MRVAIFSDIHGNLIALDAVLQDIQARGGVEEYWVLGDLAALGYDPAGVLERVYALPNVHITRGNTDRYLVTDARPLPSAQDLATEPNIFPRFIQIRENFAWTVGALRGTDWLAQLETLPLEHRVVLPDGTRVLGVHASPGTDDGAGIHPNLSQAELRAAVTGADAGLIFVGHTHWAMDITVDGTRIVNLGSVSLPPAPDLTAKYVLLEYDAQGYRVQARRVEYDLDAVIAAVERTRNPAREFMLQSFRGENKPGWAK